MEITDLKQMHRKRFLHLHTVCLSKTQEQFRHVNKTISQKNIADSEMSE